MIYKLSYIYIYYLFQIIINTGCLDHFEDCNNKKWVIIDAVLQYRKIYWLHENDENQHKNRDLDCELSRMINTISAIRIQGIKDKIVFIRFNPHQYKVNGKIKKTSVEERFNKLKEVLDTYEPTNACEILYMYYDTVGDKLKIQLDKKWDPLLDNLIKIFN